MKFESNMKQVCVCSQQI